MSEDLDELLDDIDNLHKDGRFSEALTKIEESLEYLWQTKFNPIEILKLNTLKLSTQVKLKDFEEAIILSDQLLVESEELQDDYIFTEVMLYKSLICSNLRKHSECEENLQKIDTRIKTLTQLDKEKLLRLRAFLSMVKGQFLVNRGNYFDSLDHYEDGLKIYRQLKDMYETASCLNLMGMALFRSGEYETAENFWDQSYEMFKELQYRRPIADIYVSKAGIYFNKGLLSQALELISKGIVLLEELQDELSLARVYHNLAYIYKHSGRIDKTLEYYLKSKSIYDNLNLPHEVAKATLDIAGIHRDNGEYDMALDYLKRYSIIKEEYNDEHGLSIASFSIGRIFSLKGEIDQAEERFKRALELASKFEEKETISNIHFQLGRLYHQKGDLEKASRNFVQSLQIREQLNKVYLIAYSLKNLILVNLELKMNKMAEGFIEKLKNLSDKTENITITQLSKLSEGIYSKSIGTERERKKAFFIFEQLAKEEVTDYMITIEALLNLCELLIWELSETENEELLVELNDHLDRLESIARKQNSFALLVEVLLLQAELSLFELKVEEAQEILSNTLTLAQEKGLQKLAVKISNEHDTLLDQLGLWEEFTMRLPSIAEKLELSHIEERLKQIIKRRTVLSPDVEAEEEIPVMFMIMSNNGSIIFSEYFEENYGQQIMSDVLHTIEEHAREKLVHDLERIRFQDYTFVLKKYKSLVLSYIFIGKSYKSIQKIFRFCSELQENTENEQILLNAGVTGESLSYAERVIVNEYIDEIFKK